MGRPRRSWWSEGLVKSSLSGHSLLGLALGALIYQVCLTGTLSVFSAEFKRWEHPNAPMMSSVSPEGYARAVEAGLAAAGETHREVVIFGPTPALPRLEIRIPGSGQGGYADASGAITSPVRTGWTNFLVDLHGSLHLSEPWGRLILILSAVALLALILGGVAAHPRIFRDAFHLRLGSAARLATADLHNRLSVWALPFHLAIAVTGAAIALLPLAAIPLSRVTGAEAPPQELAGEPTEKRSTEAAGGGKADVAALIRAIEAEHRPARVSFLIAQRTENSQVSLMIDTDAPGHLASGESYRFSSDGRLISVEGYSDGAAGKQIVAALFPLHYGTFGGQLVRIIYGGLGLALCAVCATGVTIWLIRRREQGRAALFLERLWATVVWGQPLALALASIVASLDPELLIATYLAATLALLVASSIPVPPRKLERTLCLATSLSLSIIIAAHVAMYGSAGEDSAVTAVNIALAFSAAALFWRGVHSGRRR